MPGGQGFRRFHKVVGRIATLEGDVATSRRTQVAIEAMREKRAATVLEGMDLDDTGG